MPLPSPPRSLTLHRMLRISSISRLASSSVSLTPLRNERGVSHREQAKGGCMVSEWMEEKKVWEAALVTCAIHAPVGKGGWMSG